MVFGIYFLLIVSGIIFYYWGFIGVIIFIPLFFLFLILCFIALGLMVGIAFTEGRKARQVEQWLQTIYGDPPYTPEQRKNVEQAVNRAIESGELL